MYNIVTMIQKIQKQLRVCAELAQDTSRDAAHDRSINRLLTNYPVDRPALPRDVTNVHPAKRENVFHPVALRRRTSWSRVEIKCRRDTEYTHALIYAITATHMHTYIYIRTYEPRYRHNHPSIEWHMRKFLMPR